MAAEEFERIVRDAMARHGWSMLELGRQTRIPPQRWYAWFRGEYVPTPRVLERAVGPMGVTIDELLAPFGVPAPSRTEPAPSDLDALVDAIDRLTAAISGRFDDLESAIAEGIARDRVRGGGAQKRPAPTPR